MPTRGVGAIVHDGNEPDGDRTADRLLLVHGFSPGAETLAALAQFRYDDTRSRYEALLNGPWSEPARKSGAIVGTRFFDEYPADALLAEADRQDATIVIGQHTEHRGTRWRHLGHTASELLHHSRHPVIIVGQEAVPAPMQGPVMLALSRPTTDNNADLIWAAELAAEHHLPLHITVAIETQFFPDSIYVLDTEAMRTDMESKLSELADRVVTTRNAREVTIEVREGPAAEVYSSMAADARGGTGGDRNPSSRMVGQRFRQFGGPPVTSRPDLPDGRHPRRLGPRGRDDAAAPPGKPSKAGRNL